MKKLLAIAAVALMSASTIFAQGAVSMKNAGSGQNGSINAPIFNSDGTTKLLGPTFTAELLFGSGPGSLSPVGTTVTFSTNPVLAGYFATNPTYTLSGFANGAVVTLQVRVWDNTTGATYANATTKGISNPFTVTLGDPLVPSSLPVLVGMNSFNLISTPVPEPATYALLGLGALGFALRRRK